MIIIIGCGKAKRKERSRADQLYTGNYFRKKLTLARLLASDDQIFILSAKYGFLRLDQEIGPYDIRMNGKGSITASILRQCARVRNIEGRRAIILAGKDYIEACQSIFSDIKAPLPNGPIGIQIQWMNREIEKRKSK